MLAQESEIGRGAVRLAECITQRWPQVSKEQTLNYYFGGSFASLLLSQTEAFTELVEEAMPQLQEVRTLNFTDQTRPLLIHLVRPIGDLDFTSVGEYDKISEGLKHRTEIPLTDIPQSAKVCLKPNEFINCDCVEAEVAHKVARITLGEQDYFITRPDAMVGYKLYNLLQRFDLKPSQFEDDLEALQAVLDMVYSGGEVPITTHQIFASYDQKGRNDHWIETSELIRFRRYSPVKEVVEGFLGREAVIHIPNIVKVLLTQLQDFDRSQPQRIFD